MSLIKYKQILQIWFETNILYIMKEIVITEDS